MFNSLKMVAAPIALSLLSWSTASADTIKLGLPNYGGNGCPAGSANATLSPDQKSISILFDQYIAQAGGSTGIEVDNKKCNLVIPVKVPSGLSIAIFKADFRGFASVPENGGGRFIVEYIFGGVQGPVRKYQFVPGVSENWAMTDMFEPGVLVWSPCGATANLKVNTQLRARTNGWNEEAITTVDSADITAGVELHVLTKSCNGQPPPPPPPPPPPTCNGTWVGGYCWYLGQPSQSCDSVCSGHGGYSEATRIIAGSNGTLNSCKAVMNALGVNTPLAHDTVPNSNSYKRSGCSAIIDSEGAVIHRFHGANTTGDASALNYRRACACNW